ncbi:MAG: cellulase family glycosylhydrolase [Corallococcus sp.]|nr:cellulase family glycosylhydrolase [Corallococcus sp.]MCM1359566.1 cellulase family glycosylhydrolase [Corallococcus sp.]MCM1395158.1 cellulase family glycosylhydrolase [Corallococcus sp.]
MIKLFTKKTIAAAVLCIVCALCLCLAACTLKIPQGDNAYTLSYSRGALDAIGDLPATAKYTSGVKVTLAPSGILSRTGYDFVCWNDGSKNYDSGATYTMPSKDVTLTAIWQKQTPSDPCENGHDFVDGYCTRCNLPDPSYVTPTPVTYAVTYEAGSADAQGDAHEAVKYAAGTTVTVLSNTFTNSGYAFAGFSDGTAIYQPGDTFIMPTHPVTLTAVWQKQTAPDPCENGHDFVDGYCTRCNAPDPNYIPPPPDSNPMLHAVGTKVVDAKGNEVFLRGTNVGGLLVTENYMSAFEDSTGQDYYTIKKALLSRFGKEKSDALWKIYRDNWWSDLDFQLCKDMGMNVLRLPFTYMDVDSAALDGLSHAGQNYDFSILDDFVERAAKYGMYVILDLHGAYGSHNGQDHSGQILGAGQVDFYSNETKIALTVKLWSALAEHFKDNVTVAGYDILNEPGENGGWINDTVGNAPHWDVFDRIYQAIRKTDVYHIVIFESSWGANNLPMPDVYGWKNCMYSFHHYNNITNDPNAFAASYDEKLAELTNKNFGVPLQMGEFTAYYTESQWTYAFEALNGNNFHWCSWNYKVNTTGDSSWGIINKNFSSRINVETDSYDSIAQKFAANKTVGTGEYYKFSSGHTLASLYGDALGKPSLNSAISDVSVVTKDGKAYLAINGSYNDAVADGDALSALKNAFYADWQNNADAGGASSSWGSATVYVLEQTAFITASAGSYQILLDVSAVPKGYIVFFHFGNASSNLECADVEGSVSASGKSYSVGIYRGWNSNLVSLTVD